MCVADEIQVVHFQRPPGRVGVQSRRARRQGISAVLHRPDPGVTTGSSVARLLLDLMYGVSRVCAFGSNDCACIQRHMVSGISLFFSLLHFPVCFIWARQKKTKIQRVGWFRPSIVGRRSTGKKASSKFRFVLPCPYVVRFCAGPLHTFVVYQEKCPLKTL